MVAKASASQIPWLSYEKIIFLENMQRYDLWLETRRLRQ